LDLARDYKITHCIPVCCESLKEKELTFEVLALIKQVLEYAKAAEKPLFRIPELIDLKVLEALEAKDYQAADRPLALASDYGLANGLKTEARDILAEQIPEDPQDIDLLQTCIELSFLKDVEDIYAERVNIAIFRQLWKYSQDEESSYLEDACTSFFNEQENNTAICLLWAETNEALPPKLAKLI